jgi:hypothetical protein
VIRQPKIATSVGWFASTWDGKAVVSGEGRIIDLVTGRRIGPGFTSTGEGVVATTPAKPLVAVSRGDGTIALWDYQRGVALTPVLRGESGAHLAKMVFSDDGSLVAAVSNDASIGGSPPLVQLWDVATKRRLAVISLFDSLPKDVAFSADGSMMVIIDWTEGVNEIPIAGDRVAKSVCERAGRTLTEREWEQHLEGVPYRDVCPAS